MLTYRGEWHKHLLKDVGKRGEKKMRPQKKMNIIGQQVFHMFFPVLDLPNKVDLEAHSV